MNSLPHAVLFDHDGVLVDSDKFHNLAWKNLIASMDLDFNPDHIDWNGLIGKPATLLLQDIFRTHSRNPDLINMSVEDREKIALKKNDIYLSIAKGNIQTIPGAHELLEWLKIKSIPCVIVSNAKTRELNFSMTELKLGSYFTAILSRDDVPEPKPSAKAFLHGANLVKKDPSHCLALDDSPTGLIAAIRAKTQVIGVTTSFTQDHLVTELEKMEKNSTHKIARYSNNLTDVLSFLRELPH